MPGITAFLNGLVSRGLPQFTTDNQPGAIRLGRYGDLYSISIVRKQHGLADEGSYFNCNNGQSGIAGQALTAFTAASPLAIVYNSDSPSNSGYKRIHVDYLALLATAAGGAASTGATAAFAIVIDTGNRYSSAGTELSTSIVNPNMDVPTRASIAKVYCGALVASAATSAARTIVGFRTYRPFVSATACHIVGDVNRFNFGGVECGPSLVGSAGTLQANLVLMEQNVPAVVIGPNQSVLFYMWFPGATTPSAPSYAPELGWWER